MGHRTCHRDSGAVYLIVHAQSVIALQELEFLKAPARFDGTSNCQYANSGSRVAVAVLTYGAISNESIRIERNTRPMR